MKELHSVVRVVEARINMSSYVLQSAEPKGMGPKVGIKLWPQLYSNLSLNLTNILFSILTKNGDQVHSTISWDRNQYICLSLIQG